MKVEFTSQLASNYQQLFNTCQINAERLKEIDKCVDKIAAGKSRYQTVTARTKVPWYFIGLLHNMECSCDFTKHLHNGDPLTDRTVKVPEGRPLTGNPPFTWEDSAEDALRQKEFDTLTNWSIPAMLFQMELFNGFGYRSRDINSPYLWSYSNHYTKGKFIKDHVFDPEAVSQQIGTAVLLRRMNERHLFVAGDDVEETQTATTKDSLAEIKQVGERVSFDPDNFHVEAQQLQHLLNSIGEILDEDGKAGRHTSDAYQRITGHFLKSDPKA